MRFRVGQVFLLRGDSGVNIFTEDFSVIARETGSRGIESIARVGFFSRGSRGRDECR